MPLETPTGLWNSDERHWMLVLPQYIPSQNQREYTPLLMAQKTAEHHWVAPQPASLPPDRSPHRRTGATCSVPPGAYLDDVRQS